MKRYLSIYKAFLAQYLKTLMEYKEDFIYGLIGFFITQFTSIIFIGVIFQNIPFLKGWSFLEILFIYGFSQIPRGIDHLFTDYLWIFSWSGIVKGEMDRLLLRPLNPLFQVIATRFQPEGFSEVIIGFILVIYSGIKLNISITPMIIIGFIIAVIGGTLIYTGIKLLVMSFMFWTKDSFRQLQIAYEISGFAKYPTTIYPKAVQGLLIFILPFAFTGFFPAAYLLGKIGFFLGVVLTFIVGVVTVVVAYMVWLKGLSIYESVGN